MKRCADCAELVENSIQVCPDCGGKRFRYICDAGGRIDEQAKRECELSMRPEPVRCPKCGSTQITANEKGFSLGKAAAGGFLLGPVGALAGFTGSGKIVVTCLHCGHQWKPGR